MRTVDLGEGRTLTIRPAGPADVDGLAALYAGLTRDDARLRFFSAYTPTRAFLERWAASDGDGGCTLVAVVDGAAGDGAGDDDGGPRIVADAGYTPLDNGNGELAVTVAADWRGWLAPFLLDTLLEEAAARGVPNLEAELVAGNRPMLSLVRARGAAVISQPDQTVVRVTISTTGRTPGLPPSHPRPRVLVEGTSHWRAEAEAASAGMDVVACPGPRGRPGGRCPLLEGRPCPLVDGADAVVVSTRGDPAGAVRAAHTRRGTPVVVDGDPGVDGPAGQERAVPVCSTAAEVVAVVADELERRRWS